MIKIITHTNSINETLDFTNFSFGYQTEKNKIEDAINLCFIDYNKNIQVVGSPGVGKTRIINKICNQIAGINYYRGEYNNRSSNSLYLALNEIIDQVINENSLGINQIDKSWLTDFKSILSVCKNELIAINPKFQTLFNSTQNKVSKVENNLNHKNKLNFAIKSFFEFAISKQNTRMILHFDDLQWANTDSLEMIKYLLDEKIENLLIILSHSESSTYQELINNCKHELIQIELNLLTYTEIHNIINDNFQFSNSLPATLITFLYNQSDGNPYLITELISDLYKSNQLIYSTESNSWDWRITNNRLQETHGITSIFENKITNLNQEDNSILKISSCFTSSFTYGFLQKVSSLSEDNLKNTLTKLINLKILNHSTLNQNKDLRTGMFSFCQNLIQDYIYNSLSLKNKQKLHKQIASFYIINNSEIIDDRDIFSAVFHLNNSEIDTKSQKELLNHAKLNLRCTQKALSVSAISVAKANISHLTKYKCHKCWHIDYETVSEINILAYKVYRISGNIALANEFLNHCYLNLKQDDLNKVNYIKLVLDIQFGELETALLTAKKLLQSLGVKTPKKANKLHIVKEFIHTKIVLSKQSSSSILALKELDNDSIKMAIKTIMWLFRCAHSYNPELIGVMSLKVIRMSLKHGINEDSYIGFMTYGIIIGAGTNNYKEAFKYWNIAIALTEKFDYSPSNIEFCKGIYKAYHSPISSCIPIFENAQTIGFENGDFYASAEPTTSLSITYLLSGINLDIVSEKAMGYYQYCQKINIKEISNFQFVFWTQLQKLKGSPLLENELAKVKNILQTTEFKFTISVYNFIRLQQAIFSKEWAKAFEISSSMKKDKEKFTGFFIHNEFVFYRQVSYLMYALTQSKSHKLKTKTKAKKALKSINKWQAASYENHAHMYDLITGLLAFLNNNISVAELHILSAVQKSKQHSFSHITALGYNILHDIAKEHLNQEKIDLYKLNTNTAYKEWGSNYCL